MRAQVAERATRLGATDGEAPARRHGAAARWRSSPATGLARDVRRAGLHTLDGGADAEPVDLRPARRRSTTVARRGGRRAAQQPQRDHGRRARGRAVGQGGRASCAPRSQQAGLARGGRARSPDARRAENAAALSEALERVRTGRVAPAARDDAAGPLRASATPSASSTTRSSPGASRPRPRSARCSARAGAGEAELITVHRRRGRAAGRRRRSRRSRPTASSWSCARAASRPTGGCSPPSSGPTPRVPGRAVPTRVRRRRAAPTPPRCSPRPWRWPRPSRLRERRSRGRAAGEKRRGGRSARACTRSATCSSTCRATRREARTVGDARARRAGDGRSSRCARSARARCAGAGMRPLVEATVADATGSCGRRSSTSRGSRALPAGHAAAAARQVPGARNRFRVTAHAADRPRSSATAGERRALPGDEGITSTQILALVREHARAVADVPEPLPGAAARAPSGCPTARRALAAAHFRRRARAGARRLAFEELLLDQLAAAAPRARAASELPRRRAARARRPTLSARWLRRRCCRSRRPATSARAIDRDRRGPRARAPDAAAADGRGRARARPSWRCTRCCAPSSTARQAALMAPTETLAEQHFATLQALMPGEAVPAALLTGSTPAARRARHARQARERRAGAGRRHARADRGRRRVRAPRASRSSTSSTASACASARRSTRKAPDGPRPARAAHDRHADPAHARAGRATATSTPPTLRELPRGPPADRDARRRAASASARAPTSGSARSCAPGARRSSSARWSRSPRRCRRRAATRRVRAPARRRVQGLPRRAAARPDAPAREAGGDGAFAAGEADVLVATTRDRGRHRRAQRDGDAGRGRRALRDLPAAPAARARRPRRARLAVPAVRARGLARACRRWPQHGDGFGWPRSTSSCAGEGELSARASRAWREFRVARLPEDAELLERARARAERAAATTTRSSRRPSTRCCADALARVGAEALEPIPA